MSGSIELFSDGYDWPDKKYFICPLCSKAELTVESFPIENKDRGGGMTIVWEVSVSCPNGCSIERFGWYDLKLIKPLEKPFGDNIFEP
jgi:hypothetical protein